MPRLLRLAPLLGLCIRLLSSLQALKGSHCYIRQAEFTADTVQNLRDSDKDLVKIFSNWLSGVKECLDPFLSSVRYGFDWNE